MRIPTRILGGLLFAAAAVPGFAATAPTRDQALHAIAVLERKVDGDEAAEAARTIVTYADLSQDVLVDLGPDEIPWVNEKWGLDKDRELNCQSMLLAAFVAGNVRSQIRSDRAEDDTYAGWLFAIDAYKRLRAKESFKSPSLDGLSRMETEGTLAQHAKDVQSKEQQAPPDAPVKKPMA
jgi:hypothetical protein